MKNTFKATEYSHVAYESREATLILKSDSVFYDKKQSRLLLENVLAKINSENEFTYLISKSGIRYLQTREFDFLKRVKIVIQKKYLLNGSQFRWEDKNKVLKSKEESMVQIEDLQGVKMTGSKFYFQNKEKRFSLKNPYIIIPEKMAKDEGLD